MINSPKITRRSFIIGTAAVGGGLALGLRIPFGGPAVVRAADGSPEIGAWVQEQVPQCGYCQPGMIMATAALLAREPNPDERQIAAGITNLCRCGTYPRVRRAIRSAARLARTKG